MLENLHVLASRYHKLLQNLNQQHENHQLNHKLLSIVFALPQSNPPTVDGDLIHQNSTITQLN